MKTKKERKERRARILAFIKKRKWWILGVVIMVAVAITIKVMI